MRSVELTECDRACLRKWGISAAEDTRSPAATEERLVVPEWLRRALWRQFWADQDALFRASERMPSGTGLYEREGPESTSTLRSSRPGIRLAEQQRRAADSGEEERGSELTFREPLRAGIGSSLEGSVFLLLFAVLGCCLYVGIHILEH
jgi:hypothetical protein